MYYIYRYVSPSGKSYIGQTSGTQKERQGTDCIGYQRCTAFYNAIKKYGIENFEYSILDCTEDKEEIDLMEQMYIQLYDTINNGYNISYGGVGCRKYNYNEIYNDWNAGLTVKELIEKYDCDPKTIRRVLNFFSVPAQERVNRGNVAYRQKYEQYILQLWNQGKSVGEIAKEVNKSHESIGAILDKMGIDGKDRIKRSAGQYHTKSILQYDKQHNLIKEFPTIMVAEKELNISHSNIVAALKGRRKSAGGFIWEYKLDV